MAEREVERPAVSVGRRWAVTAAVPLQGPLPTPRGSVRTSPTPSGTGRGRVVPSWTGRGRRGSPPSGPLRAGRREDPCRNGPPPPRACGRRGGRGLGWLPVG